MSLPAANTPIALNIFQGKNLYLSSYQSGSWSLESTIWSAPQGSLLDIIRYTAGPITPNSLATTLGIVFEDRSGTGLWFLGSGSPATPVNIPQTVIEGYDTLNLLANEFERSSGAFYYGGKYFLFVEATGLHAGDAGQVILACLASSDGGMTWGVQDLAGSPVVVKDGVANDGSIQDVHWDGESNVVYVFVQLNSDGIRNFGWFQFDMNTGVWSELSTATGGADQLTESPVRGFIVQFDSSHFGVVYSYTTNTGVFYRSIRSGHGVIWGAETQLRAAPYKVAGAISNGSIAHLFFYPDGLVSVYPMDYAQLQSDGTISDTLFTFSAPVGSTDGYNLGAIVDGNLLIPRDDTNDVTNAIWTAPVAGPYNFTKQLLPLPSGADVPCSCAMLFFVPTSPTPTSTTYTPSTRGARRLQLKDILQGDGVDSSLCLARDFTLLDKIDPHALSCNRRPLCPSLSTKRHLNRLMLPPGTPPGARRFFETNFILLPTPGDTTVLSFRVPYGYDGIILGNFQLFTGQNFVEGSGDIIWRLKINLHYARDWGNLPVSLGSLQTLSPVEGGVYILSGDLITYQVNAVNTSGLLTPGLGRIICGLYGFFYPRT